MRMVVSESTHPNVFLKHFFQQLQSLVFTTKWHLHMQDKVFLSSKKFLFPFCFVLFFLTSCTLSDTRCKLHPLWGRRIKIILTIKAGHNHLSPATDRRRLSPWSAVGGAKGVGLVIIPSSFKRGVTVPSRPQIDKAAQNVTDGIWKCVWQSSGGLQKPGQTPSPLQITDNGPWA